MDGRADHRMVVLGSSNKHLGTDGESSNLEFPLLADIASRTVGLKRNDWLDPIVVNETSGLLTTKVQQSQKKLPHVPNMDAASTGGHLRRPRGRPKKSNQTSVCTPTPPLVSKAFDEAQQSWETAKLLGIASNDERAVIAEIRKSKRILIMEDMDT